MQSKFGKHFRAAIGVAPNRCQECKTRFKSDEAFCAKCGGHRSLSASVVISRVLMLSGLSLITLGGVVYGLEVLLEPITHQMYVDALSMNYERESYAGTVAGPFFAFGVVIFGLGVGLKSISN